MNEQRLLTLFKHYKRLTGFVSLEDSLYELLKGDYSWWLLQNSVLG